MSDTSQSLREIINSQASFDTYSDGTGVTAMRLRLTDNCIDAILATFADYLKAGRLRFHKDISADYTDGYNKGAGAQLAAYLEGLK